VSVNNIQPGKEEVRKMKMSKQFEKIAKLAGQDPAKLLEKYNITARTRFGRIQERFVIVPDKQVPTGYQGYLFVSQGGQLFSVPPEVTKDGKEMKLHVYYHRDKKEPIPELIPQKKTDTKK